MTALWSRFKTWVNDQIHWVDVVFIPIALGAWVHNMESALKLDLNWLLQFYGVVRAFIFGGKAVDSKYNSPSGQPPQK